MTKGQAKDVSTNHWKTESSKQCHSFTPTRMATTRKRNEK